MDDDNEVTEDIKIEQVIDQDENNEKMEIDETDHASTPKVGTVFSVKESPVKRNQSLNSVIRPTDSWNSQIHIAKYPAV